MFLWTKFLLLRKKTLKQERGTAIGIKFAPLYSLLFKVELEKEILIKIKLKPSCWWRCTVEIFFLSFSNPNSFDRRYNDLEKWVIEGSYSEQEVWKQILKARGFSSNSLLDRENTWEEQTK